MGSDDRFYLMEMRNRPAMWGDIGSLIRLEGVVVGGGGTHTILVLPGTNVSPDMFFGGHLNLIALDLQQWSEWLQHSDQPEILVGPSLNGGATLPKIWHRKLRYEISGAVQQKVWAADGFKCVYCGAAMGSALLTVDHFIPLELGGKNDVTNYLSACKRCNKDKGSENPVAWCERRGYKPEYFTEYLHKRKIL